VALLPFPLQGLHQQAGVGVVVGGIGPQGSQQLLPFGTGSEGMAGLSQV